MAASNQAFQCGVCQNFKSDSTEEMFNHMLTCSSNNDSEDENDDNANDDNSFESMPSCSEIKEIDIKRSLSSSEDDYEPLSLCSEDDDSKDNLNFPKGLENYIKKLDSPRFKNKTNLNAIKYEYKIKAMTEAFRKAKEVKKLSARRKKYFSSKNSDLDEYNDPSYVPTGIANSQKKRYKMASSSSENIEKLAREQICEESENEPEWFKKFEERVEMRHKEKMDLTRKLLKLCEAFINK